MKNGFDPKIGDSLPGRPDTQGLEILRLECGWLAAFVAGDTIINNTFPLCYGSVICLSVCKHYGLALCRMIVTYARDQPNSPRDTWLSRL